MTISNRHDKILSERGFDIELLERLDVYSDSRLGEYTIAIPYFNGNQLVNTKYRTIAGEKRFTQEAGKEAIFWNVNALADDTLDSQPLIITEGELDAIAAIQAGFGRVLSVPNGAPATADQEATERYRFIERAPAKLADCREIILATDSDDPGKLLMDELAKRFGRERCRWVKYPRGCKDLADALRTFGTRGVVETLNRARWIEMGGLYQMGDIPPAPAIKACPSGFPGLNDHYRLRPGDLTVVTGVPSHGKTTVVNDIACRMAMRHKWRVAFASFEQTPQRDHKRFLRTWFNAKLVVHQTPEEIDKADAWINDSFLFATPGDNDIPSLEWVTERMAAAVIRYGVKLCVIDPWNEIEHERPPGQSVTDYTGWALREFRRFAKRYQVHVIVVAHPMKMRRLDNGKYPIPSLYDIADSAHWYNRPDVGIVIFRDSGENTIIRVAKTRYHDEIGRPGDVTVKYVMERATFEPAEE